MKSREELTRTTRAFWEARAVLTAVELGVFTALGSQRLTAPTLARRLSTSRRGMELLLDALVGLELLEKSRSSYAIRPAMRPYLLEGPESALGMLRHHADLWTTWSKLTDCVRTGKPARHGPTFRRGPEKARAFTLAMRDGARRLAPLVAQEVDLRGRRHLFDLGGGPGVYAAEFARRYPGLRVTVLDLKNVVAVGRELVREATEVRDRVDFLALDLEKEPIPEGADAMFLSHVIHGMSEEAVKALFSRAARALPERGLLVVRDFFLSPDRTRPQGASIFALNMLVATGGGRSYSARECGGWLRRAGFRTVSYRRSKAVPDTGCLFARR